MERIKKWFKRASPAQLLIYSFLTLILIGGLLLVLPISSRGERISLIDAFFTATSAVCVTGLVVLDTGRDFSGFGQAVILLLIQLGGIGIIGFGTFIVFVLGRKTSLVVRNVAYGDFPDLLSGYTLRKTVKRAIILVLGIELVGGVLLYLGFGSAYSGFERVWQSVFHSVSAFCNAGFSLNSDNLVGFADNSLVNLGVVGLMTTGALGYIVLLELAHIIRHRLGLRRLSLHSKIVLFISLILIVLGAVFILILEEKNALAGLSIKAKLLRGFFQSTARCAGFNTVEISALSEASLMALLFLMFIGGAPGSTAGGVKVTSAGIMLAVALSLFRRDKRPTIFGRSIGRALLDRSLLLVIIAFLAINLITLLLLVSQTGIINQAERSFLALLFETISALGTVGWSMGVTGELNSFGKICIIFAMFLGRVGPLALVFSLQDTGERIGIEYPEEEVMIG